MAKRPLDVLHAALNTSVTVELRGGRSYRGTLDGYDHPHLNLIVKDAEELDQGRPVARHENVLVRGDSIVYVIP